MGMGDSLPIPPNRRKKPMTKAQIQARKAQYAQGGSDATDIWELEEAERQKNKNETEGLFGAFDL